MSPLPFWQQCVIIALCFLAPFLFSFLSPGHLFPPTSVIWEKRCRLLSSHSSSCTA